MPLLLLQVDGVGYLPNPHYSRAKSLADMVRELAHMRHGPGARLAMRSGFGPGGMGGMGGGGAGGVGGWAGGGAGGWVGGGGGYGGYALDPAAAKAERQRQRVAEGERGVAWRGVAGCWRVEGGRDAVACRVRNI